MPKESPPIFALSALNGDVVVGSDDRIGTVKDFLFVDQRWQVRWLVVDTGTWLPGRKVLIHPSAITEVDFESDEIITPLTRKQVEGSPDLRDDQRLSKYMEERLFSHYGWNADWGASPFASASEAPPALPGAVSESIEDPHLRSFEAIQGYRLRASDGEIGSVENFLIEQPGWNIRYLIVKTGTWLLGKEVLLAPYAVAATDWLNQEILLNVTREQVNDSPPWDPLQMIDEVYQRRLHQHYGWPNY